MNRPTRPQLKPARYSRRFPDRHLHRRRRSRRRRTRSRREPPRHHLYVLLHILEIQHPRPIPRILIRRRLPQLRHEERRRRQRLRPLRQMPTGDIQPTVNRAERLIRQTARQPVRGVEHAHVQLRIAGAAQVRLQTQVPQRPPINRRARHQRHRQHHTHRHRRHQTTVPIQPPDRDPKRRRQTAQHVDMPPAAPARLPSRDGPPPLRRTISPASY